ncbi:MAG TPA: laccase domain-containing protein [Candidatus Saccharimonadales bacterium]|nr:laccase domain-containing protein [Candidatus Saccharimonadales bacterium]
MNEMIVKLSAKADGDMSRRFGSKLAENNRRQYLHKMGLQNRTLYYMDPEHADHIAEIDVNKVQGSLATPGDAIILSGNERSLKQTAIVLIAADCIPMGISAADSLSFGLAHLGWKSLNMHLAERFVKRYTELNNLPLGQLSITIGPSIRKESYIYPAPIRAADDSWKPFIHAVDGDNESLDPIGYLNACLAKVGISREQIFDCNEDTAAPNSPYFSHYQATKNHTPDGRGMCLAYLA